MLLIEVHKRLHVTPDKHRYANFPVLIGRSFQNDLQLDDKTVSAQHAKVEKTEEGIFLTDLGSTNGLIVDGKKVPYVRLDRNINVNLGNAHLRFIVADEDPEVTRDIDVSVLLAKNSHDKIKRWVKAVTSLMLLACVCLFRFYLQYPLEDRWSQFFQTLFSMALVGIGTAVALSLVAKIQSHVYNFLRILTWIWLALAGVVALNQIFGPLVFLFPWNIVREILVFLVLIIFITKILIGLGHSIFVAIDNKRLRKRALILSVSLLILLTGVNYLIQWDSDNFDYDAIVGYLPWNPAIDKNASSAFLQSLKEGADDIKAYRAEALEGKNQHSVTEEKPK